MVHEDHGDQKSRALIPFQNHSRTSTLFLHHPFDSEAAYPVKISCIYVRQDENGDNIGRRLDYRLVFGRLLSFDLPRLPPISPTLHPLLQELRRALQVVGSLVPDERYILSLTHEESHHLIAKEMGPPARENRWP